MLRKTFILCLIVILFTACGSQPDDDYLGFWQIQNESQYWHPAVIEILKDGNTYLYRDAITFEKSDYLVTLKSANDKLILDSQYVPELPLSLIEKKSVLLIGQRRFARINESDIHAVRETLALDKQKEEQALKDLIDSIN